MGTLSKCVTFDSSSLCCIYINPYLTNGFSHHYHWDKSTFILGVLGVFFFFFFFFFLFFFFLSHFSVQTE